MKRLHVIISGRVQGVGFRISAFQEGSRLGLKGWVRNCPDGTVEALVEGSLEAIESFHSWCRKGPPLARVLEVKVQESLSKNEFSTFEVK